MNYAEAVKKIASTLTTKDHFSKVFCPSCDPHHQKRKTLAINTGTGYFRCWRDTCGIRGWLTGQPRVQIPSFLAPPKNAQDFPLPTGFRLIDSSEACAPALEYMISRGVSLSLCKNLGLGACVSGDYRGRVIIPVVCERGQRVGWIGRAWYKNPKMKYVYPLGMSRGSIFYNQEALFVTTEEPLVVVEGALDAMYFWPNAVACMGKISSQQYRTLLATSRPICIAFDGDMWTESMLLANELRVAGKKSSWVKLPPKKDPDEVERDWFYEQLYQSLQSEDCLL